MSMTNENRNKESFQLLPVSGSESGSSSDIPEFTIPKRKVKLKRKYRNGIVSGSGGGGGGGNVGSSQFGRRMSVRSMAGGCSAVVIFKVLGVLIVSAGLGITVWLAVTLHIKVDELRKQYQHEEEEVEAVNGGFVILGSEGGGFINAPVAFRAATIANKKMKKRKELDALVPNGKKVMRKKHFNNSSGSGTGTELLSRVALGADSDTTDTEEFSVLQPRAKFHSKRGTCLSRLCGICVPLCVLILVTACVLGSATLVWMQFGMRQEVDLLRDHIRKVEEGNKGMPAEFHGIHSQLKELQNNHSALRDDVTFVNRSLEAMSKEIAALRKGVGELKKSLAETPELETLPKDFKELQSSLASMGSKITDFESNLAQVKSQLVTNDDDKKHWGGELEALRQRIESLSSAKHESFDESPKVFAYVDAEVKKLDDIITDVNGTIWEKLQWAVDDLHEHHKKISSLQISIQNVTNWMSALESNTSSVIASNRSTNIVALQEQVENMVNETLVSLLGGSDLVPFGDREGPMTVYAVLDYVRSLIRLYIGLLSSADRMQSLRDDKLLAAHVDLNATHVLHEIVEGLVENVANELKTKIVELNSTFVELLRLYQSSKSDLSETMAKVTALQDRIEQLSASLKVSKVEVNSTVPTQIAPLLAGGMTTTSVAPAPVAQELNNTTSVATNNNGTMAVVESVANPIGNATGEVSDSSKLNVSSTASVSGVASQDVNGTVIVVPTNSTSGHVFKPNHTGGSLDDPNLRKPEDSASD